LIEIESAGAIVEAERAYESFDVPKGTLRGAPPVPDDDVTTLRTNLYLVAGKALGSDLIATLTQTIMSVRRDLMHEEPIFAQITAPSTDQDAYLPLHRGAAAVYNSTTQSFMDEYGNWIYLTPMVLGGIASYPELMWLHKLEVLPAIMIAAICVLIAGWAGLVVGFLWSTVLLYHATFCINSLAHVQGTQALCHGR
jgi:hypothetical protein